MSLTGGSALPTAGDKLGVRPKDAAGSLVPMSGLLTIIVVILAAPNLLLWQFLGLKSSWLYASGILLLSGIAFAAWRGWRHPDGMFVNARLLLICLIVAGLLLLLGGEGRLFYANVDWQVRDAVLRDLVIQPWPFVYTERGATEILRAPLGIYLFPAFAGKLLGLSAADPVLLLQNVALLGALLAASSALFENMKSRAFALLIFIMFSGMDVLGTFFLHAYAGKPILSDHIEFWSGYQYSSHLTQLFWVPQHAFAGWIAALLYLFWRRGMIRVGYLLAVIPLLALWSPLSAMGAVPFAAYAGLHDLFRKRLIVSDVLAPAAGVLLSAPALLYLAAGGESVGAKYQDFYFLQYVVFMLAEVVPYLVAVFILTRHSRFGAATFAISASCLLLMPLLRVGEGYDFMMRASIPALAILSVLVADAAMGKSEAPRTRFKRLTAYGLALALVIGAVTPLLEVRRAIVLKPSPQTRCNLIRTMYQSVGLDRTSGSTYFARPADVPAVIRPSRPHVVQDGDAGRCWERPWQQAR